jgi:hypothetical protein
MREDFRAEHPGGRGRKRIFSDPNRFVVAASPFFTLTSALVINRRAIQDVDAGEFLHSDLATFHLFLKAALAMPENLILDEYVIASKRQNSAGYRFGDVFVDQFWEIIDAHRKAGLSDAAVKRLERKRLVSYYPKYILDARLEEGTDLVALRQQLERRFGGRFFYLWWLKPILVLPQISLLAYL